jgi:uncharacterized protein (DUF433 family)
MTTIRIDLPDDQAAALTARAATQGLTLESWLQKRAAAPESLEQRTGAIDWSQCPAVESVPGKVSGAWVLRDTRMPISVIFENLEYGASVEDIIENYHVTREQIQTVLEFAARSAAPPQLGDGSTGGTDARPV